MANEPPTAWRVVEVHPGDLCRATMHDDPTNMARAMAAWFGADLNARAVAAAWLAEVIVTLAEVDG